MHNITVHDIMILQQNQNPDLLTGLSQICLTGICDWMAPDSMMLHCGPVAVSYAISFPFDPQSLADMLFCTAGVDLKSIISIWCSIAVESTVTHLHMVFLCPAHYIQADMLHLSQLILCAYFTFDPRSAADSDVICIDFRHCPKRGLHWHGLVFQRFPDLSTERPWISCCWQWQGRPWFEFGFPQQAPPDPFEHRYEVECLVETLLMLYKIWGQEEARFGFGINAPQIYCEIGWSISGLMVLL